MPRQRNLRLAVHDVCQQAPIVHPFEGCHRGRQQLVRPVEIPHLQVGERQAATQRGFVALRVGRAVEGQTLNPGGHRGLQVARLAIAHGQSR